MKTKDYEHIAETAKYALKHNLPLDSRSAWTLIQALAEHAAKRGQRPAVKPTPMPDAAILIPYQG